MARQTDYTLKELREMLESADSPCACNVPARTCVQLPNGLESGLIFNEIGHIFLNGGDEGKEAEADLLKMLGDKRENIRGMAYFYLSAGGIAVMSPETPEKLKSFEEAPENFEPVQTAKARLKTFVRAA